MSLDLFRQFHARVAQLLPSLNEWRLAVVTKNETAAKEAVTRFRELLAPWEQSILAAFEFQTKQEEWTFSHALWRHGGKQGIEPVKPQRPADIPDVRQARDIVERIYQLRETSDKPFAHLSEMVISWPLRDIIRDMDVILKAIEQAMEEKVISPKPQPTKADDDDGPIDRNQLAKLSGVSRKALTERRRELPRPVERGTKLVPIYRYQSVRAALGTMYPDRAFLLPASYREVVERLRQLSREGSEPDGSEEPS